MSENPRRRKIAPYVKFATPLMPKVRLKPSAIRGEDRAVDEGINDILSLNPSMINGQ